MSPSMGPFLGPFRQNFWYIVDNEFLYVFNICSCSICNPYPYSKSIFIFHIYMCWIYAHIQRSWYCWISKDPHHLSRTLRLPSQEPQYSIRVKTSPPDPPCPTNEPWTGILYLWDTSFFLTLVDRSLRLDHFAAPFVLGPRVFSSIVWHVMC